MATRGDQVIHSLRYRGQWKPVMQFLTYHGYSPPKGQRPHVERDPETNVLSVVTPNGIRQCHVNDYLVMHINYDHVYLTVSKVAP